MAESMEVDNTKAIALPILFILALLLAIFITRKSLAAAFPRAKSELRLGILFFGGAICTMMSIFLFPTPVWNFGIVGSLFAYMFTLVCAPGMLEKHASKLFLATSAWFAILLGIPNRWSSGILVKAAKCSTWFPVKSAAMCKDGWITFVTILCICMVLINFFILLVLMSFAFDQAVKKDASATNKANKAEGEYAVPFQNNDEQRTAGDAGSQ